MFLAKLSKEGNCPKSDKESEEKRSRRRNQKGPGIGSGIMNMLNIHF